MSDSKKETAYMFWWNGGINPYQDVKEVDAMAEIAFEAGYEAKEFNIESFFTEHEATLKVGEKSMGYNHFLGEWFVVWQDNGTKHTNNFAEMEKAMGFLITT